LAALVRIECQLAEPRDAYWRNQVEIQRLAASAWVAFVSGRRAAALQQMRTAAAMERVTDKSVITPGPLAPAGELLGEMLLQAGQPAQASAAFVDALSTEPNRFRSTFGAGRAAALIGNIEDARRWYSALLRLAVQADTNRSELVIARAFLARSPQ
jgi:hypothetical protein